MSNKRNKNKRNKNQRKNKSKKTKANWVPNTTLEMFGAQVNAKRDNAPINNHTQIRHLIKLIKEEKIKWEEKIHTAIVNLTPPAELLEKYEERDQALIGGFVRVSVDLIDCKIATIEEMHSAAWEAFNGLMEADAVRMNLQEHYKLEVTKPDPTDYIIMHGKQS